MEHNPYYDGLSDTELAQNTWLIVAAELLWYCESHHTLYIRYSQLRKRCDEVLNRVTDGDRPNFGGGFKSVIYSSRYEEFWYVDKTIKNQTRICPKVLAIQNEIKGRKIEILNRRNNRVIRILNQVDTIHRKRSATNSLSVSTGVRVRVKRATDEKPID